MERVVKNIVNTSSGKKRPPVDPAMYGPSPKVKNNVKMNESR
jgi:hypothetical protein